MRKQRQDDQNHRIRRGWSKFKADAVDNDGDTINNYHYADPPGSALGTLCTFSHYNSVNGIIPFYR